jgi:hypothetical protein
MKGGVPCRTETAATAASVPAVRGHPRVSDDLGADRRDSDQRAEPTHHQPVDGRAIPPVARPRTRPAARAPRAPRRRVSGAGRSSPDRCCPRRGTHVRRGGASTDSGIARAAVRPPLELCPATTHHLGTKLCRRSNSFAPRRSGFDSRRLHSLHGAAACVSAIAPARVPGSCSRENPIERREDEGSNPSGSTPASVVSTASTRPLYGRGAGSTPAGGSLRS